MGEQGYDLRELQLQQLAILDELKRVCDKNNIHFYLAYGSCLGALRHQGFIPWDDDIDVLMFADDVERLFECKDDFSSDFFLQSRKTDPGFLKTIMRLRKNNTTCIEQDDLEMKCNQGIYIDIYPLYHYPDSKFGRLRACCNSILYQLIVGNRAPLNHGRVVKALGNVILLPFKDESRRSRVSDALQARLCKMPKSKRVADLYGMDLTLSGAISYKTEWFGAPELVDFEGRQMPIPSNADAYMKERYGADYMEMPSEEKQRSYHRYAVVEL